MIDATTERGAVPHSPAAPPLLPEQEVHVWTWHCCGEPVPLHYRESLCDAERARAAHFMSDRDGDRFIEAHAGLRLVLGGLLGIDPATVAFSKDDRGKPRLQGEGDPPLFFSLSHSNDLAAVAISARFEVGLDIERLHPSNLSPVTALFSKSEQAALARLPDESRARATLCALTRKEAFVKAIGLGLTIPLDSFDVSLAPHEPARLLRIAGAPDEAARWQLSHLAPAEGYVGAVAAQAIGWRLVLNEIKLDRKQCFHKPGRNPG